MPVVCRDELDSRLILAETRKGIMPLIYSRFTVLKMIFISFPHWLTVHDSRFTVLKITFISFAHRLTAHQLTVHGTQDNFFYSFLTSSRIGGGVHYRG